MTRSLGLVAGFGLAFVALAAVLYATRAPTALERARDAELLEASAGMPRPLDSAIADASVSPVGSAVVPEAHVAGSGPAGIVDTLETSRDPRAVEAALRAVLTTYSSRSTRKPAPDAALEHALARHFRSEDGAVTRAALAAARIPLMAEAASPELASAIASTIVPEADPARRMLALEALDLIRPDRRGAAVLAAIEQALAAPEPEVVSTALFALAHSGPSLATLSDVNRSELAERVRALLLHPNPGVRGRALSVLAEIADFVPPDVRLAATLRHLPDPHPYVRAEAANLAAQCRNASAIHALMHYVGDLAPASYDLSFVDIEGRPGVAEHRVPGRKRVADAALFTILALSRMQLLSTRLELTLAGSSEPDARVLENTAIARAWYREVAAEIPRR